MGRERELDELEGLLARPCLLTLAGSPGIGKTRLARELGNRALRLFGQSDAGGVWLCDLGDAQGAHEVAGVVARVAALPPTECIESVRRIDEIGRALAHFGPSVVILDAADKARPSVRTCVARWLSVAREARIVVTSRKALGLETEHVHELPRLGLPEPSARPELADTVRLFEARAKKVRDDYRLGSRELACVAELVAMLDGNPLAIGLAAPNLHALGAEGLLAELRRRVPRGASPEHTVQSVVEWSLERLPEEERRTLSDASLFRGGFDLAAARALLTPAGEASSVDRTLASLCTKSLLVEHTDPEHEGLRYGMAAPVHAVAERALSSLGGERESLRKRYAAHYLGLAAVHWGSRWQRAFRPPDGFFEAEMHNLLQIVESASDLSVDARMEALLWLEPTLYARWPYSNQIALVERVLAAAESSPATDPALAGDVALFHARLQRAIGAATASRSAMISLAEKARASRDRTSEGFARHCLAEQLAADGEQREAERQTRAALDCARFSGEREAAAVLLCKSVGLAREQGDLERADALEEGLLGRRSPSTRARLTMVYETAKARLDRGRTVLVSSLLDEAKELGEVLEDPGLVAKASFHRGVLLLDDGRLLDAQNQLEAALEVLEVSGDRYSEAMCHLTLAVVHRMMGELREARQHLDCLFFVPPSRRGVVAAIRAGVEAMEGNLTVAARGFDDAEEALERNASSVFATVVDVERGHLDLARARLHQADSGPYIERAQARLERSRAWFDRAVAVRVAARQLERSIEEASGQLSYTSEILVDEKGAWFQLPGRTRVDCRRRRVIRRALMGLVRQRVSRPGAPIPTDQLVQLLWNDDTLPREAGRNRLYVTVNGLRRLGLGATLLSTGDGYLLDPSVPVRFVQD